MNSHSLQAVLRSLAEAESPADDGEVLRRFLGGDEGAFAELVRRHGRLVWSACQHLTGSDAEADDAFQATFLILVRRAGSIRDPGRVSAWLHGVAYKVCAKARQAAKRRAARERDAATGESASTAVADSAWDRALATVHEEVGRLPETLRVPFVLCCLEGRGATEAAAQLGWKLGTFSGRLTRAKAVLMARLDARGVTLGAVAGLGLIAPPAAAVAKAAAMARVGFVVPSSVLQLSQGVIGMSTTSFKVLAAAVLLTCGLGVGTGWVATADAQAPFEKPPAKVDPAAEVKRLQAELEKARLAEETAVKKAQVSGLEAIKERLLKVHRDAVLRDKLKLAEKTYTAKWEYDFVVASDVDQAKFVSFLQDREARGWEYNGTTSLRHDGKPAETWVFRRPMKGAEKSKQSSNEPVEDHKKALELKGFAPPDLSLKVKEEQLDAKAIEAGIAKLQAQLETLKAKPTREHVMFAQSNIPLDPTEMMTVLGKLAEKKFAKDRYSLSASSKGVAVEGDKEVVEWFTALVKKLAEK